MDTRVRVADSGDHFRRRVRAIAETHQRIGEILVGVHGNVAGDVVENVRFGKIVQLVGAADGDGGGEFAVAQAIEKQKRGNVPADRFRLKPGQRAKKLVDVVEPRNAFRIQAQRSDALQEMRVGVLFPSR